MSLRTKILLITLASVFFITSLVSVFFFYQTRYLSVEVALSGLRSETRLLTQSFDNIHNLIFNDLAMVEMTPPINGIIRASQNNGIDPFDQSSLELWRSRLAQIFTSILNQRPHYAQMRYIGLADQGKEIVRVNQTKDSIEVVSQENLQSKEAEPYFKLALSLKPRQSTFYELSYNRENGQVDKNAVMLRAITPVYNGSKLFGMLIINVDYPMFLHNFFKKSWVDKDIVFLNAFGDYVIYNARNGQLDFQLHDYYTKTPPDYIGSINTNLGKETFFQSDSILMYFVGANLPFNTADKSLAVGLKIKKSVMLKRAYSLQRNTLIWVGLVIILGLLITTFIYTNLIPSADRNNATETLGIKDKAQL